MSSAPERGPASVTGRCAARARGVRRATPPPLDGGRGRGGWRGRWLRSACWRCAVTRGGEDTPTDDGGADAVTVDAGGPTTLAFQVRGTTAPMLAIIGAGTSEASRRLHARSPGPHDRRPGAG